MKKLPTRTICGLMLAATMTFAGTPTAPASAATAAPPAAMQRGRVTVPDNTMLEATLNTRLNAGTCAMGNASS